MPILAFSMPVADPDGSGVHPNAVFIPDTVVMNNINRVGGVGWTVWHNGAALLAGDLPIAGVQHHTDLNTALYNAVVAFPIPAGTTAYGQVTAAALIYLGQNVKDTPGKNTDGTPLLDAQGQPVMVAYFANATVVQIG
jgi:hypothetical protein